MSEIFIYQVRSHYTKPEDLDASALVLDNSSNERPDWYEYWPIRKFLLNEKLDDDSFYGFLSPSFKYKTNLSISAARDFVKREGADADIVLLSPSIHLTAYYWNVFKFGEACHPGLFDTATEFFERIGQPTDLDMLVTNSRNEIYSNYMFAKPRFWRAWLSITEQLIAFAESPTDEFGKQLRKPTSYRGHQNAQIKIFIMERIPTWLLARDSKFCACVRDPFVARSRLHKLPGALICDALKIAYVSTGHQERYKDIFNLVSPLGKLIGWLVKAGDLLRFSNIQSTLAKLASYWTRAGRA